jgi:hypothetical protein
MNIAIQLCTDEYCNRKPGSAFSNALREATAVHTFSYELLLKVVEICIAISFPAVLVLFLKDFKGIHLQGAIKVTNREEDGGCG